MQRIVLQFTSGISLAGLILVCQCKAMSLTWWPLPLLTGGNEGGAPMKGAAAVSSRVGAAVSIMADVPTIMPGIAAAAAAAAAALFLNRPAFRRPAQVQRTCQMMQSAYHGRERPISLSLAAMFTEGARYVF